MLIIYITMKTINNNGNDKKLTLFPSVSLHLKLSSLIFLLFHHFPFSSFPKQTLSLSFSLSLIFFGDLLPKKGISCLLYPKTNLLRLSHRPLGHLSSLHLAPNKKTLFMAK